VALARLCLRWWADRAELWVDGHCIHQGDLFDTACRWPLPARWWRGQGLNLELRLRSPLHDDGALVSSCIELEPLEASDPLDLLGDIRAQLRQVTGGLNRFASGQLASAASGELVSAASGQLASAASGQLASAASGQLASAASGDGPRVHLLGHAHLDLAWLWPVADTWQAAERTFTSVLDLMERYPELHFAHSTPALYTWLQRQRPSLFERLLAAVEAGRFEPINGPWVETDCVLIATASLLRQFQQGQRTSRQLFQGLEHALAWLPDSFGFSGGLPAVAAATGVRWFCTHKLAWNATNPFPHRLFRWRSRCGAELLALNTAPIGTDGDPLAIASYWRDWQRASGISEALWLPGVGDHGGGPSAEMLEQLRLWRDRPEAVPQRHGRLRDYLARLEPCRAGLPVWRDELYLELHRGCATSRPDQKRHNRSLERLLREAELASVLAASAGRPTSWQPPVLEPPNWEPLLFQQFHDILPGTAIPEVFEQAEPQWRRARRQARTARDRAMALWLGEAAVASGPGAGAEAQGADTATDWWLAQLQPLPARPLTLRLPAGWWQLEQGQLPQQPAPGGGCWVQLPGLEGVVAQRLSRGPLAPVVPGQSPTPSAAGLQQPVRLERLLQGWLLDNGLLSLRLGAGGLEQLWDDRGEPQLAGPLAWCRYRDQGEFWDAWDLAADYRQHPLPWRWQGLPELVEQGPLCVRFLWRGRCGTSSVRLDGRLLAGSPWLELTLAVEWRQRHELLRLELPLAAPASRWAADCSGGVIERPAVARSAREQARWEVTVVSWLASVRAGGGAAGGLAVLLDGPQGASATAERLGVSLLRAPTWPDPGADNGWQRLRLALMPYRGPWSQAGLASEALRLREPLWLRPASCLASHAKGIGEIDEPLGQSLRQGLPPLPPGVVLIGLRPDPEGPVLTVQNLTPCRRHWHPGPRWRLTEPLDGLNQRLPQRELPELRQGCQGDAPPQGMGWLAPWQLGFWRLAQSS
jgi:alpha-mannosidase